MRDRVILVSRCSETESWSQSVMGPGTLGMYVTGAVPGVASDGSVMITVSMGRCLASHETEPGIWTLWTAVDPDTYGSSLSHGYSIGTVGGRFTAIGEEGMGSSTNIWVNQFDPETGWGSSSVLRAANGYVDQYKFVTDSQGRAAAVWLEAQGPGFNGGNDVWSARYR